MPALSRALTQEILQHLERAIYDHQQWYEFVVKHLVCRLPVDPRYAAAEAHRECEFGRWYYGSATGTLRNNPGFVALEPAHEEMHRLATRLLHQLADDKAVRIDDYEAFSNALANLRLQLQSFRRELENALGDLDPLTGAFARIGMLTWLRQQHELVRRGVLSCGVAMMDLDDFKSVNDTFGHQVGDRILAHCASFLIGHIRPYDRLFRYGGDEFLMCLPDTDAESCRVLVDRLRDGLGRAALVEGDRRIDCTLSCGVALLDPDVPVERAIERADRALYAAKRGGRNRTEVWKAPA